MFNYVHFLEHSQSFDFGARACGDPKWTVTSKLGIQYTPQSQSPLTNQNKHF